MQLPVPLCHFHYQQAISKSPAQRWCEQAGVVFGLLTGLAICTALMFYWLRTGQGWFGVNLFLALVVGSGIGLSVWIGISFWLAPLFASSGTKAVWQSVRLEGYDPARQILSLNFMDDTVAELTVRENLEALYLPGADARVYEISAHLLSDDIRWSGRITTRVLFHEIPSLKDAESLLAPVIEKLMIQQNGQGSWYELSDFSIDEIRE